MKKYLSIVLALVLCLACFVPASALAAETEERYSYSLVNWRYGPFPDERPIEEWAENYFNIDLELIYIDQNDYWTQLNTRLAGGEVPDVFLLNNSLSRGIEYWDQGIIGSFTEDVVREHVPSVAAVVDKYAPQAWSMGAVADGELIAIPAIKLQYAVTRPLHYNKTWLDNLGLEVPETIEEFEEVVYAFAKNDPDGNGVDDTFGLSNTALESVYGAFGVQPTQWIANEQGKLDYGFTLPGMRDALTLLAKWYKDGVLDPEYITGENQGGYWAIAHAFDYQKIGVSGMGTYAHWWPTIEYNGVYLDPGTDTNTRFVKDLGEDSFEIVMGCPPKGPTGVAGNICTDPVTWRTVYSAETVANEGKFHKILQVSDVWYSDAEVNFLLNNGEEGTWWNPGVDDKGNPTAEYITEDAQKIRDNPFDFYDANPDMDYTNSKFQQYQVTPKKAAQDAYLKEVVMPLLNRDYTIQYRAPFYKALPSKDLLTDINTMIGEAVTKIITGEEPIEYYDECLELFKSMGGEQVTAEANEIYAELTK